MVIRKSLIAVMFALLSNVSFAADVGEKKEKPAVEQFSMDKPEQRVFLSNASLDRVLMSKPVGAGSYQYPVFVLTSMLEKSACETKPMSFHISTDEKIEGFVVVGKEDGRVNITFSNLDDKGQNVTSFLVVSPVARGSYQTAILATGTYANGNYRNTFRLIKNQEGFKIKLDHEGVISYMMVNDASS